MPDLPRIGTNFAGYRIDSLIGRGGMSVVYRAEHPRLGNMLALKLLSPELTNDEAFRERFVRESRLAAGLNHPNIIPIYDAGSFDDVLYIAMRYVEGSDLKALIRARGALPPEFALGLLSQVARALDAAHVRSLVHRDVKPANILVEHGADDRSAHAYLADFGLMKHSGSRSGLTATGQFMGTIDYVAPEQIEGKSVDARTDVYSLGCVLYECLTGRVPFVKDADVAIMWAHVNEAPERISRLCPTLPSAVDDVVDRALAKSPDERYASCPEMMAAAAAAISARDATRVRSTPPPLPPDRAEETQPAAAPPRAPTPGAPAALSTSSATSTGRFFGRSTVLAAALVAAALAGAGVAYAVNRSGSHSSAGSTRSARHHTGSTHTPGSKNTSPSTGMGPSTGMSPSTGQSSGEMLATQFKQHMPELSSTCAFAKAITCEDLPEVRAQGRIGRASKMTMTAYANAYDRGIAYTTLYRAARRADRKLRRPGSGRCYGWTWENEGYWYHAPEHQSRIDTGADGSVFCYTDPMGTAVIVWTQNTRMGTAGQPFIGQIVSPTRDDAFRYFVYVHHHIGM